jgi:hypothetical protein
VLQTALSPPEEFDKPYTAGPILKIEAHSEGQVKKLCPDFKFDWGPALACSYKAGTTCKIIIAADAIIRMNGFDPDLVYRHEIGHCLGWPADHKGAR